MKKPKTIRNKIKERVKHIYSEGYYDGQHHLDMDEEIIEENTQQILDFIKTRNKKRGGKHDKVYSNIVLTSNPPQYPWICRKCGKEGVDLGAYSDGQTEYDKIKDRFSKEKLK